MDIVRLCYHSTLAYTAPDLRQKLMHILDDALDFNYHHDISGVLYYGNGYFFQCIEGGRAAIEQLYYEKIVPATTHNDVHLLHIDPIEHKQFKQWNMKFALPNAQLRRFFATVSADAGFNPALLNPKTRQQFLQLLHDA